MLPFVPQKDINGKLFVSVTNPADLGQTEKNLNEKPPSEEKTGSVKQPPINRKRVNNYESKLKLLEDNVSAEVKQEIQFFTANDKAEPTEVDYEDAECSTMLGMFRDKPVNF